MLHLIDLLYEMVDEAKNAPPKVTRAVKVNSHLRPVEFTAIERSSSVFPTENIIALAPWTNIRKTSSPPRRETMNHQYCCKNI